MEQFQAFLSVIRTLTNKIKTLSNQGEDCPWAYCIHMSVLTTWSLWKKDSYNLDRAQVCKSRRAFQTVSLNQKYLLPATWR